MQVLTNMESMTRVGLPKYLHDSHSRVMWLSVAQFCLKITLLNVANVWISCIGHDSLVQKNSKTFKIVQKSSILTLF